MDKDDGKPTVGASSFDLEAVEERDLVAKANNHDHEASLRLYRFYDFVKLDRASAIKWLKKSAEDGNPQGQYILGKTYLDDPSQKNLEQAKYWLSKSASNGYAEAKEAIKHL
jgi:TPR repeat protein